MKHRLSDISAAELKEKIELGRAVKLLDVREQLEYYTYNIGGEHLPLGHLLKGPENIAFSKDDEIVVICQRGIRSETACRHLFDAGYTKVRNLAGGLLAYRRLTD